MKYIAYSWHKNATHETGPHDTREAAARELLLKFPKLKSAETAETSFDGYNWFTYGRNIQAIRRDQVKL